MKIFLVILLQVNGSPLLAEVHSKEMPSASACTLEAIIHNADITHVGEGFVAVCFPVFDTDAIQH